jgi:hypothetical protein
VRLVLATLLLLGLALAAAGCGGGNASEPVSQRESPDVAGRGSAGGTPREQDAPGARGVLDTGGVATVVFVDADG